MTKFLMALLSLSTLTLPAQNFQNPDLNGVINGHSSLPGNWQNVPYGDPNCIASATSNATPDLTGLNAPDPVNGVTGNPYSGSTFVSGLFGKVWPNNSYYYQEGIMQTVNGLTPNQTYLLSFYQTVVKQYNAIDPTGSWSVYLDGSLLGTTNPTTDNSPLNSASKNWEQRTMLFTPANSFATFKFLPTDNDTNHLFSPTDITGAVRMGIDLININTDLTVNLNEHSQHKVVKTIFPNPATEGINLKLESASSATGKTTIRILNYTGKILRTIETHETDINCDIRDFPSGVYFMKVEHENTYEVKRFVKE